MIRAKWIVGGQERPGTIAITAGLESAESTHYDLTVPGTSGETARVAVEIGVPCEAAWALSHDRRLVPLGQRVEPPWPAGRFLVIQQNDRLYRMELPWASRLEMLHQRGEAVVTAILRNPNADGISHWASSKLLAHPSEFRLAVCLEALDQLDECLWLEPYPHGAPAALCITDHPDFDTIDRARRLTNLLAALDLRVTKGVFPSSDPKGHKVEPGLDVPAYAEIARDLHAAGSEIAFHGLGPRYRAPSLDECHRRAERMAPFQPATWIDHGTGPYLFSRDAVLEGGVTLTDFLAPFGVVNYWSYVDIWQNPSGSISSQVGRGDIDVLRDASKSLGAALRSASAFAELPIRASHLANNLLGEIGALALRKAIWVRSLRDQAVRSRRLHRFLANNPEVIYGRNGCSFTLTRRRQDVLCFDTLLMTYPAVFLEPERIDRLRRESGLSLVHSYLCDPRRRGTGGAFERSRTGDPNLSPRFVENLGYVSLQQRDGELAVLPFCDLRRTLSDFSVARLMRRERGWSFSEKSLGKTVVVGGPRETVERLQCDEGKKTYRGNAGYVELRVGRESALLF